MLILNKKHFVRNKGNIKMGIITCVLGLGDIITFLKLKPLSHYLDQVLSISSAYGDLIK